MVSIGSASRSGGEKASQAAFGVLLGPESVHNGGDKTVEDMPVVVSNEGALVLAAMAAIPRVINQFDQGMQDPYDATERTCVRNNGSNVCELLILTDSAYPVKEMNEHIWKLKNNGFKTYKSKKRKERKAAYATGLEDLDNMMDDLEERDVPVWFWLVKKEDAQEANALAKLALHDDAKIGDSFEYDWVDALCLDEMGLEVDCSSHFSIDSNLASWNRAVSEYIEQRQKDDSHDSDESDSSFLKCKFSRT